MNRNRIVIRTERGWIGHFICADRCKFRRNTLLTCDGVEIVVSTVGLMVNIHDEGFEIVGCDRYFETMAFHTDKTDTRWHDMDVSRQVYFDSPWSIAELDADDRANDMHEEVVRELTKRLAKGRKSFEKFSSQ